MALVAALAFSLRAHAQDQGEQDRGGQDVARQPGAVYDFDKKAEKPAPAPKHDISGVWEPAGGPGAGIHANGAGEMPSDGKPEHELPFTPLGRQTFAAHKPTFGVTQVPSALTNDPMPGCNPQGFPRIVLHNFRTSRVIQTPENVVILYEFNKKWRVIWTDVKPIRFSDECVVVDPLTHRIAPPSRFRRIGRPPGGALRILGQLPPHSDALHVIERYRRADQQHMDMTITIDDPKMYTKPWVAVKLRLRLQTPHFDIREMECAPIETEEYNKEFADPAAGLDAPK